MARFELIPNLPLFQEEIEENPKSENLDISSLCVFCGFVTPSIEIVCFIKCVIHVSGSFKPHTTWGRNEKHDFIVILSGN